MRRPRAQRDNSDQPLLHLVYPAILGTGIHRTFGHRFPPMGLLVLAALARRKGWRVRVIDMNFDPLPDERPDAAAISVWTTIAPQAYRVAAHYRDQGVPVMLGGIHPSLLPGEALRHADSVLAGEGEGVFPVMLDDLSAGRLQPLYQGHWQGMDAVPMVDEWVDILRTWPLTRYAPMNTLQTTRGCRFNCDFCSVIRMNGRGSRHSSPERVVEEVRVLKRSPQHIGDFAYVFFLDDDLAADLDFCGELCEEILRSGCRFTWGAQASIGLAQNTELLALAARAGMRAMFVGFESVSRDSLVECNKKNRPHQYGELVEKIHKQGIGVEGGFIFGFDTDRPDVFEETVEFVDRIGVDVAHFAILTPYPGTHTFARMASEGRITTYDWRRYNLYNAVHTPAQMTAAELDAGLSRAYRLFYSGKPRLRRFLREVRRRDLRFHGAMTASNHNYSRRYRHIHYSTEPGYEADPDDIAGLTLASSVPAQEALEVAFANVRLTTKPAANGSPANGSPATAAPATAATA